MIKKEYCTQNEGDCVTCSLVNYGRDCMNNPLTKKELYMVKCGNGWKMQIEAETLSEVKNKATEVVTYTQQDFWIEKDGAEILRRKWYGSLDGIRDFTDPIQFGSFGFYGDWFSFDDVLG